jgi:diaminohydroxyphosphoribosylaminopyrimidine deaminase/5-amino-6-(5-phosphoribosylamino)uracil reductase
MSAMMTAASASRALPSPEASEPHLERRNRSLMRAALFQARRGLGRTWPNPSVGAVIAIPGTGEIVGSACTAPGGRPHAEVLALAEAGKRARGAVMVTTLEPCAHFGLTPPCADAIADAGLSEVLYGTLDPDPRVSGSGAARLAAHGVRVRQAPFADEARWITLGHMLRIGENRPFVQMKLAVDIDGFVAAGDGQPVWVTDEDARARAHLLRATADSILVGRNTAIADNPLLTCRLPGLASHSPVRVVLTAHGQLPPDLDLFTQSGPPVWVLAGSDTPPHVIERLKQSGARVLISPPAPQKNGRMPALPIRAILRLLANEGITRLLVEGGPTVARSFLDAEVADEILIFQGRHRMPASAKRLRAFVTDGPNIIMESGRYREVEVSHAGQSIVRVYRARMHLEA